MHGVYLRYTDLLECPLVSTHAELTAVLSPYALISLHTYSEEALETYQICEIHKQQHITF